MTTITVTTGLNGRVIGPSDLEYLASVSKHYLNAGGVTAVAGFGAWNDETEPVSIFTAYVDDLVTLPSAIAYADTIRLTFAQVCVTVTHVARNGINYGGLVFSKADYRPF